MDARRQFLSWLAHRFHLARFHLDRPKEMHSTGWTDVTVGCSGHMKRRDLFTSGTALGDVPLRHVRRAGNAYAGINRELDGTHRQPCTTSLLTLNADCAARVWAASNGKMVRRHTYRRSICSIMLASFLIRLGHSIHGALPVSSCGPSRRVYWPLIDCVTGAGNVAGSGDSALGRAKRMGK